MQLLHRLHALVDVFFCEIDVELLAHLPKLFVLGTHLPDDLRRIAGDNHARGNYLLHFYDRAFGNNSPLPDLRPDAEDGAHADNCPIADTFSMNYGAVPDSYFCSDSACVAGRDMNDHPFFHGRSVSDFNAAIISPYNSAVADITI